MLALNLHTGTMQRGSEVNISSNKMLVAAPGLELFFSVLQGKQLAATPASHLIPGQFWNKFFQSQILFLFFVFLSFWYFTTFVLTVVDVNVKKFANTFEFVIRLSMIVRVNDTSRLN